MRNTLIAIAAIAVSAPVVVAENYDVSFKGGTAKEYYNTLQETIPGIRLVVHPDVDVFMMPPVELPDVSEWAAVWAAANLIEGIDADLMPGRDGGGDTYVVAADPQAVEAELSVPTKFDLVFEGGSLEALVIELREIADANIMLSPEAAGIPVLPMRFRRTTVWDVLGTLEREPLDPNNKIELRSFMGPAEGAIYALSKDQPAADQLSRQAVVFSLAEILSTQSMTAEEVIGAIETAMETVEDSAIIRYHAGTEVLVVRCDRSRTGLVQSVVNAAEETAHHRANRE